MEAIKAMRGNTNALRTGHRTQRAGIVLGELGKRHRSVYQQVKSLRRGLESLLRDAQGQLPLMVVAQVNEACRWELVARIAQKAVADAAENTPASELLSLLNTGANATRNRNSIMGRLLDGKPQSGIDPWAILDQSQVAKSMAGDSNAEGSQA